MNEQEFKNKIDERWGKHGRSRGRIWSGLLIFCIGILLLLKTSNLIWFPTWFFTWPMLFIAIGLFSGLKHGFRGGPWLIFLLIGGLSLADHIDPTLHIDRFIWPMVLMAIGLMFILRPRGSRWRRCRRQYYDTRGQQAVNSVGPTPADEPVTGDYDSRDYIDVTAVFGGLKKNVLSKNFKGGEITSFMGGSEIDLTQADFTGRIKIDVTNIFGGTKLVVPSSWDVQNDISAVFGGVDDKRQVTGVVMDHNKVLVLDGSCVFGGIEIRSY
jgi:hypothetical protein